MRQKTVYTGETGRLSQQDRYVIEALDASIVPGQTATLETSDPDGVGDTYKYDAEVQHPAHDMYVTTIWKHVNGRLDLVFTKVYDDDTGMATVKVSRAER